MNRETGKGAAAERAMAFVRSGSAIGLGTGSTVRYVLEALAARLKDGRLDAVVGVPTSEDTAARARALGIPLTTLDDHPRLALTIDGADEIDPGLNLIKGRGGALLREKIVASASDELIIVADASKLVPRLGSRCALPVEVIPFALAVVMGRLAVLGGTPTLRRLPDGSPLVTDEGHRVVDYDTGPIADPAALDVDLRRIPGVVEHGLFLGLASRAIIGDEHGTRVMDGVV